MYELWFLTLAFEGLLFSVTFLWRIKRTLSVIIALLIISTNVWLLMKVNLIIGLPIGLIAVFRILNMMRILKNRMHQAYLRRATAQTSLHLFLIYPVVISVLSLGYFMERSNIVDLVVYLQLIIAGSILIVVQKNVMKLRFHMPEKYLVDNELPTVTVAIPARNETVSLQECLNAVLANDYPKLEVIVLDDCSQGKTAEIIKSYAQKGVRFVKGQPPAERWLAKNQAYEQLLVESSGDFVLFCGVDTRIGSQAIRSMVNLLKNRNKSMLSVLPVRSASTAMDAFIQPMRYWWELALPRRLFNRPPVLNTCWMIERESLRKLGGFGSVSHAIIPEGFFARELAKEDKYSFVRSSNELEVKTNKNFSEQLHTAIRNRYPQIRRRPEWALLLTAINLLFLVLPFAFLVASVWENSINALLVGITCVLLVISHVTIVSITDPENSLFAVVSFPVAAISEMVIGYISMVQYEFLTIEWKDRNICIPVMHVIPRLPKV